MNITYCQENIKAVFHEMFDEALKRYNDKQTRADRRIENYYETVSYTHLDVYKRQMLGGWTALHYFLSKGLTEELAGGLSIYGKYSHSYTCVGFPSISEVSGRIHAAGGLAVLAHPGEVIPQEDMAAFRAAVLSAMAQGLDGIECHYSFHPPEVTDLCLALCREHGWLVTCGSDCHGGFGHSRVGELPVKAVSYTHLFPSSACAWAISFWPWRRALRPAGCALATGGPTTRSRTCGRAAARSPARTTATWSAPTAWTPPWPASPT